jgi:hypothetical protein
MEELRAPPAVRHVEREMNVPLEFLRVLVGLIGLLCAWQGGRTAAAASQGRLRLTRVYGWVIRCLVCLLALVFRHPIDVVSIVFWVLAVAAAGAGWWILKHQSPPEDNTHVIFPDEP